MHFTQNAALPHTKTTSSSSKKGEPLAPARGAIGLGGERNPAMACDTRRHTRRHTDTHTHTSQKNVCVHARADTCAHARKLALTCLFCLYSRSLLLFDISQLTRILCIPHAPGQRAPASAPRGHVLHPCACRWALPKGLSSWTSPLRRRRQ